jgi:hypothetical protein
MMQTETSGVHIEINFSKDWKNARAEFPTLGKRRRASGIGEDRHRAPARFFRPGSPQQAVWQAFGSGQNSSAAAAPFKGTGTATAVFFSNSLPRILVVLFKVIPHADCAASPRRLPSFATAAVHAADDVHTDLIATFSHERIAV